MAFWFPLGCGMLGSKRAQDLLEDDPEAVLEASDDQVKGITHA